MTECLKTFKNLMSPALVVVIIGNYRILHIQNERRCHGVLIPKEEVIDNLLYHQ